MYIPEAFREDRKEALHALIERYSFGTLVTGGEGGLTASHLPFLLDPGRGPHGTLLGHMARANPQWRSFEGGGEVLVMFQGPHTYISPSWYEVELSVPTWNYIAVHAYGTPSLIEDGPALYHILEALVRTHEAGFPEPWPFRLPEEYVKSRMKAIVGFEIPITRLEGKLKLSQNRSLTDQEKARDALLRSGDATSVELAKLMARTGEDR
jgi:transcriptional regulator